MSTAVRRARPVPAVLHDIDWATYKRIRRAFDYRRGWRVTYDRGTLEIMSPLWEHEKPAYILGRFIDVLTEEMRLACQPGGSVTLRRKRKSRGLEPDKCYWIASAPRLEGKTHLDLRVDPPPDLAIEMEVTHSSLDRMGIYAAFGVPEVWRVTAEEITFYVLEEGRYQARSHSLSFPLLTSADLLDFLKELPKADATTTALQFRKWVREILLKRAN
jgi:Uma2 family endonuclease